MQYQEFNKKNLQNLRNEMNALLAKYGQESNMEFEIGNMRFSSTEVEIKIKSKISGAVSRSDKMLEAEMKMMGLVMEKNGRRLVSYKPSNWKYPFIFEDRQGKRFKINDDMAKLYFSA